MQFASLIASYELRADGAMLSVIKSYDKQAATIGNGTMVAIGVDSKQKVNALHAKALELGGKDEGAPGPRGPQFYAGYFRRLEESRVGNVCRSRWSPDH